MKEVFRVTKKYWVMEEGGGLVLGIFFTLIAVWLNNTKLILLSLLMPLLCLHAIWRWRKQRVEIDQESIELFTERESLHVCWSEVILAKFEEQHAKPRKTLVLVTRDPDSSVTFAIDQYDYQRIWELAQQYVPPAALEPDARLNLPGHQEWKALQQEELSNIQLPFEVSDSWLMRGSGWMLFVMFGLISLVFLEDARNGQLFGLLICSPFILLGLYGILTVGKTVITPHRIERHIPLGVYAISWDEIKYLEKDVYGSVIFWGDNKYLAVLPDYYVSSKGRDKYALFLNAKFDELQIETRLTRKIRRFAKNTKVS